MPVKKLKPHTQKQMQLSFRLTDEREMASGRKKSGKPVIQPVPLKGKAAPTFASAPAGISKIKNEKMDVGPPQKPKGEKQNLESFQKPLKRKAPPSFASAPAEISKTKREKMNVGASQKPKGEKQNLESFQKPKKAKKKSNKKTTQKRPVPDEDTKSETSPSKKKPKRELVFPVENDKPKSDKTNTTKGLAKTGISQKNIKKKGKHLLLNKKPVHSGKPKDSGLKITKQTKKPAIKVSKNNKKTHAVFKVNKLNNSETSIEKIVNEVNGSKAQHLTVPKINASCEDDSFETFEDNSNLQAIFELKAEEECKDFEENSEDEQSSFEEISGFNGFLANTKIIRVSENYRAKTMPFSAPIKKPIKESELHIFEGECQASVRKFDVFGSLAETDNDDTDDEYFPRNTEDLESEDFDSEQTDSEDFDSEYYESGDSQDFESGDTEDFDEEDSDDSESDEFGSDIFDSDDLDSTYEPPIIDGFFDDTPPHLKKEPLIIEEIFDDDLKGKNQNALVNLKLVKKAAIITEEEKVEEEAVVTMEAEVTNGEFHTDTSLTEPIQVSQPNETPFYRNPQATPTELSVFENSLKSNYVIAVIKENIELYGTLVLTLLSGQIVVNGHRPRTQEPLTIYSLKGLPWVSVSPSKTKRPAKDKVNWQELNENFTRAQLDRIQDSFQSHTDAIVLLQRNAGAQRLLETFGKHMAQNVFPLLNNSNRPYHQSESLLQCLVQNSDLSRTVIVPQVWNKLKIQAKSRIIIAGGKGVGKSSLLRYLINRNLGQLPSFLLIDLDIGQPEVFVPQTVSCTLIDGPLLGPGFLLNKQPDCAVVVGHTNVVMCAEQYARAATQLIQRIQNDGKYANIPWLINTMGYNKGFGTELMALLVDRIRPTDLIQIASPIAINNFDSPLEWGSLSQCKPIIYTTEEFRVNEIPKYTLHQLMSAVPPKERGTWSLSAKDMRYSNLLARLSSCLTGNAKSLADCLTLGVPLDAVKVQHPTSDDYTREELIRGMEANVVYLCHKEANGLLLCLGIGVVRAIDYERQKLFLVPAMPLKRISLVNTLIPAGELTLPQGYFRDQGQDVSTNVPFVFILDDSKSSKSIQQIYHRAPAFLGVPAGQRNGN